MTELLDAIARVFVAPSSQARAEPVAVAAPAVVVCGRGAEPVAAALALLARSRGPAVVCAWGSFSRRASAPSSAGARRLAASMQARGLSAAASGRLVSVSLDADPLVAATEVVRAGAAAGSAPVVTALCGPRDPAFDELLAAQDLGVVVAGDAPEELVRLGVAALGETSRRAVAAPQLAVVAAWFARAGVWATPGARRALAEAQSELP